MLTTIIIELKIEHDGSADPYDTVDRVLDLGVIQDAINDPDFTVASALCFSVPGYLLSGERIP
jgi:hypothetical protein